VQVFAGLSYPGCCRAGECVWYVWRW